MSHATTPPQILTAENLLAKMRAGVKEVHEIRMREMTLSVRVLSIDEMNNIRKEAIRLATVAQGDDTDKNVIVQKLTLKLASATTSDRVPMLSDKLLSLLSVDEVNYLYNEYIRAMDIVNPSVETIDPEVFKQIIDELKKNNLSSKDLSIPQLRAICTAFVDLIQRLESQPLPTDNSSGGQQ